MSREDFYPRIADMKCRVCGKKAVGWNVYGAFCSDEHYRVSDAATQRLSKIEQAKTLDELRAHEASYGGSVAFVFTETGPLIVE